ncbi:TVP38/TMEM64 family protein [Synechococcus sp. PCC 7336]|uniref:TVP38/TMEM64 family protein n=1 Tax=Synechococcus sp. PCC 7336 TaxID=195250 RepID=UPI00034DC445|nr:TVP38/TMEM64 family protein [Synechococcus sp. PCC 7336]
MNLSSSQTPRRIRLGLLLAGIIATSIAAPALAQEAAGGGFNPQQLLVNALSNIESWGAWGPLAFIGLYIVATVAFLPGSILTLGAGFVFGVVEGAIFVFIGAMVGATAAFIVGRYVARGWVAKKIEGNRNFKAIDDAIGREGGKLMFLIRLSPAFPFNVLNYAMGLTQISLRDYIWGTTGILPGTIMYVYLGSLAGDLATIGAGESPTNPAITWTIRIVGLLATIAVTVYVTKLARKALKSKLNTEEQPQMAEEMSS